MISKSYLEVTPRSRSDFRSWLSKNHHQSESIWVVIFKSNSKEKNLTAADVAEEALCFGWIDSVPNKVDDDRYKLRVSPRRPKSAWSALNKRRVKKLIKAGLMTSHGLQKVELAKKDGSLRQLESSDRLEMPKELAVQFKKNKRAEAFYQNLAPSSQRPILEWIQSAKTEKTKLKRINETVRLALIGIRANNYLDLKKMKK
jgi:uncharacterized protein YdeI (YjbR/CyaY-like superfamily)